MNGTVSVKFSDLGWHEAQVRPLPPNVARSKSSRLRSISVSDRSRLSAPARRGGILAAISGGRMPWASVGVAAKLTASAAQVAMVLSMAASLAPCSELRQPEARHCG